MNYLKIKQIIKNISKGLEGYTLSNKNMVLRQFKNPEGKMTSIDRL